MEKKTMILVGRETFGALIKQNVRLSKMLLVLEYICSQKKVAMTLTCEEICEVVDISQAQLSEGRAKGWIKGTDIGCGIMVYKAYDVARLAEKINRRRILRRLAKIPTVEI